MNGGRDRYGHNQSIANIVVIQQLAHFNNLPFIVWLGWQNGEAMELLLFVVLNHEEPIKKNQC